MFARALIPQTATASTLFPRTIALMHCLRAIERSSRRVGLTRKRAVFQ